MKARSTRFEPIALATNDSDKELVLTELDLVGDALQARLRVRSHGFAAEKAFMVDDFSAALAGLLEMSLALRGEVRLGAAYEEDEVMLSMNDRGQLFVQGRLVEYGEGTQILEFQFRTDQTALASFVRELESLRRLLET